MEEHSNHRATPVVRNAIILTLGVIFILAAVKGCQIYQAIAGHANFTPAPETVTSAVVTESVWRRTIAAVGSIESVKGAMLSSEASGKVATVNFDSGQLVEEGAVLVELDTQVERANVRAAKATRDEAKLTFQRAEKLRVSKTIAQSEYDDALARYQSAEANALSLEAALNRRMVIAPFAGLLGIRQVNIGQYLSVGSDVVPLQALDPLFVNFSLAQSEISLVREGQLVRVMVEGFVGREFLGEITAIDSQVDQITRTIALQATLPNADKVLRPGMFSSVVLESDIQDRVKTVPLSAISYAPYGDMIYVLEQMKDKNGAEYLGARQQVVKLGARKGDSVAILSGLKIGDQIATSGTFKLRPAVAVSVNNDIQPGSSLNPTPQDQ